MNITDDVYTIYRDGVTPTEIPRVDIATGKLLEKNTKKSKKRKKKKHSKKGEKEVERDKRLREEEATIAFSEGNNCEQKTECLPCLVHRCFYGREDDIDEVCNETCPFTEDVCGQGALCGYPPDIKGLTYCIGDIETACL